MGRIDPANLSEWFEAYGASLVLYARQWLPSGQAEDAVQDVFVRLTMQRRPPASVKAWLFRAVRNAAVSQLRSRRRRLRHERQLAAAGASWFEPRPGDLLDAQTVQQALAMLPFEQREVIVLRIWAGMTLREAAEVIGRPMSTVHSRYRAGLAAIRQRMEKPCSKSD